MRSTPDESPSRIDRRTALRGLGAIGAASLSGCVRRVRSIVNREPSEQLAVTIVTPPADADQEAVTIGRHLGENLQRVGIDASRQLLAVSEFYREILVNQSFDIYVAPHPGGRDPDFLYEALHSVFADESGWQNPFGFTGMAFDDRLEAQRVLEDDARRDAVADILRGIADEQPFVPICSPVEARVAREDRFDGWRNHDLATSLGYLGLEPLENAEELRGALVDPRATENLNPISVEYRNQGIYVNLLYDSLGVADGDEIRPWLAESWEYEGRGATVTLRRDVEFHDGEPLTADDVAFTYRFLQDTSMGGSDVPSPSPRYRAASSAVEEVEVVDDHALEITTGTNQAIVERVFTVPILPQHIWSERTDLENFPGVPVAQGTTEAVVTDNVPAIGSGPFEFVEREVRNSLTLERNEDHFSLSVEELPEPTVDRFATLVEPASQAAVETVQENEADVTVSPLESNVIGDVPVSEDLRLFESSPSSFYHVGFNVRDAPFSNPYFRRNVASLLDKEWLVAEVFDGYAEPVATPLFGDWVPSDLEWSGRDPRVPFFGIDGELDVSAARDAFRDVGFRYDEDGNLLVRS